MKRKKAIIQGFPQNFNVFSYIGTINALLPISDALILCRLTKNRLTFPNLVIEVICKEYGRKVN